MTMGRGPHRAQAPHCNPQGAQGARDRAMGGRRGQTPDPGRPVLPSHGRGGGGGGRSQSRTPSLNPSHSIQDSNRPLPPLILQQ